MVEEDIKFLLSFAPATCPESVTPGLPTWSYVTGEYEGDVAIAARVKEIVDRYGIDVNDIDDPDVIEIEARHNG